MPARRPARPPPDPGVATRKQVTVHIPVSLSLSDDELADAATVNEVARVAVDIARDPEVRALGRRLVDLARRRFGKKP
jgi:hypothetical protein